MSVLYLLVPLALLIAAGWVLAFAWAVGNGQMDDLDTPSARMLHDDEPGPRSVRVGSSTDPAASEDPRALEPAKLVSTRPGTSTGPDLDRRRRG